VVGLSFKAIKFEAFPEEVEKVGIHVGGGVG